MPRFTHPIWWRPQRPDPSGPLRLVLRADIDIELRRVTGSWRRFECLVDTGASFSTISTDLAVAHGLAVPPTTSRLTLETADGTTAAVVRDASIETRFARLPEVTFDLLWLFRDDIPATVEPVLGLHNLIDLLTVTFDGTMRPGAMMGIMEFVTRPG